MKRNDADRDVWSRGLLVAALSLTWGVGIAQAGDANRRVDDVLAVLKNIAPAPQPVPCEAGGFAVPTGGHLQGIQQATIAGRPFAILSGSSSAESYLALIALGETGGRVVAIKPLLAQPFKHAGGFQVCGDYLAVGIEDDKARDTSRIWILELAQLLEAGTPKPAIEIERRGAYKRATAGAVGMAKVDGHHLLCVGTWDSATIDIYVSNGKPLNDSACGFAFRETWDVTKADCSDWSDSEFASYQNLNLIVDGDDRVFLVGFARSGNDDVMDVFEVQLQADVPVERRLMKRCRHVMKGRRTSFQHGAGLAIVGANTVNVLSCGYREFVVERFGPVRR